MPILHQTILLISLVVLVLLTQWWRVQPFLALVLAVACFGFGSGLSVGLIGKAFGEGFATRLQSLGLVVVAASMIAAIADASGATGRLAAATAGWRRRTPAMVVLGLIAGPASTSAAAFAVLTPLRRAIAGHARAQSAVALGLALSAGYGMLLPSPLLIAGTAILRADWLRVVGIGVPVALIAALAGAMLARFATDTEAAPEAAPAHGTRLGIAALIATTLLLIGLLIVQSLGDIPSEPLGRGSARELVLGVGRPLILLLAGVGIMALATGQWRRPALSERGWPGTAIISAAPLLLLTGAAGGMQAVNQATELAEVAAEHLLSWHGGLLLPFALAAIVKTMEGSSLVAAITAAGMVQPLLGPLGLDTGTGRALAVVAVGVGAVTVAHINDPLFWLITDGARLRPARALLLVTGGTLLQAAAAMAVLLTIAAVLG